MQIDQDCFDQTRTIVSRLSGEIHVRDGKSIPKPPNLTRDCIDIDALATLLYSGTIFPPQTIYSNYASVGLGGTLKKTDLGFEYTSVRDLFSATGERMANEDNEGDCITALAKSIASQNLDFDNTTLLLSEGKDSTGIALALAEIGVHVDCITFANSDTNISFIESLAQTLGHRLTVVRYKNFAIQKNTINRVRRVFEPTVDQAFLSYLVLPMEQLHGRVIIDGMGNDIYMGHLPTAQQRKANTVCGTLKHVVPEKFQDRIRDLFCTDYSSSGLPFRSFTECQGFFNGFCQSLVEKSTGGKPVKLQDLDANWQAFGYERARALSRGRFLDNYSYSGKSIALAEMLDGRAYFPWSAPELAKRFLAIPDGERFNWPKTNKLLLRSAITNRIKYAQPKIGFRAPIKEILSVNRELVEKVIRESVTLGPGLQSFLLSLKPDSPRLACGFLYCLWEHASR
ncbi:asparagine synthase-related protein [Aureliella helgolandensis]|uniref:Asparagine synthetase domain-containing protein n=1 Tax=Aureliella helgolandensis TaxID=2527968 RepID=A0A518GE03_9BACT|nr:asparagine synthase-related protein [Aureliella helgolandensis]QDV26825.1 hypothetical protein Q31a_52040 [Aureliella helgolandensis]